MLIQQINNHVDQALARLMQQYLSVPTNYSTFLQYSDETLQLSGLQALIAVLVDQLQNLEDVVFDVNNLRQLWNGTSYPATGAQLDGIGQIVGAKRNGLGDVEYLVIILGTIAQNFSDDTIPTLVNIANILFAASLILVTPMFPAEVNFQVSSDLGLPAILYNTVANILQNSVGGGIGVGFITIFDTENGFTMGDDFGNVTVGTGGGFGDDLDPSVGGMFAYDVFTNSGA
jgi:hypothetical protein